MLKVYPAARVRGRLLSFVNGMSANERTGFINSWTRMGLDAIDLAREPGRQVVTVVNNRADRVSRSEVFARILVEDAAADVHVLIGTNLPGLMSYLRHALDAHVSELEVVTAEERGAIGATQPFVRLGRHLARLRIAHPDWHEVTSRLSFYASGVGLEIDPSGLPALEEEVRRIFAAGSTTVAEIRTELEGDAALRVALVNVLRDGAPPPEGWVECAWPPTPDELVAHVIAQLARLAVHARLRARLEDLLESGNAADVTAFHATFRAAYRELFLDAVVVVPDPGERGDDIIDRCARVCPPGTTVTVLGIQNIKGTGLDFVYRWLALDQVSALAAAASRGDATTRVRALRALESFEDHGLLDAAVGAATLAAAPLAGLGDLDVAYLKKVRGKLERVHADKLAALGHRSEKDLLGRVLDRLERWIDPLDSIRRRGHARQVMADLVVHRISHARAAVEMRKLTDRQKGGWLGDSMRRRRR